MIGGRVHLRLPLDFEHKRTFANLQRDTNPPSLSGDKLRRLAKDYIGLFNMFWNEHLVLDHPKGISLKVNPRAIGGVGGDAINLHIRIWLRVLLDAVDEDGELLTVF